MLYMYIYTYIHTHTHTQIFISYSTNMDDSMPNFRDPAPWAQHRSIARIAPPKRTPRRWNSLWMGKNHGTKPDYCQYYQF